MARAKLVLVLVAVAALAIGAAVPAPAISFGQGCADDFHARAGYGCPFRYSGPHLSVGGVALDSPGGVPAQVTVWITAGGDPDTQPLLVCKSATAPLAASCFDNGRRRLTPGDPLYCWATGADNGLFGCSSY